MDRDSLIEAIKQAPDIDAKVRSLAVDFCSRYLDVVDRLDDNKNTYYQGFATWIKEIAKHTKDPFQFDCYHKSIRTPFDYYAFGNAFIEPLIDQKASKIIGKKWIEQAIELVRKGENVVLFSNHQVEADPQVFSILLDPLYEDFAPNMTHVAGERVTLDPFAIPFSMGRNLLCIYSKKYIDYPPEKSLQKREHNQRAMHELSRLLKSGGQCMWVAPSGGRDRPGASGAFELSAFDPKSIDMFRLLARKAKTPTHFFPVSLWTYAILPPPDTIQKELGEQRITARSPVGIAFDQPIDFTKLDEEAKAAQENKRDYAAKAIYTIVNSNYQKLLS